MQTRVPALLATALLLSGSMSEARQVYPPPASHEAVEVQPRAYGQFRVEGNQIIGGVFAPAAVPAYPPPAGVQHHIVVSFARKTLEYYRRTPTGGWEGVFGRAVVTPSGSRLAGPVYGWVTQIDTNPTWCLKSDSSILQAYPDLRTALRQVRSDKYWMAKYPGLPGNCFPPGHPENAMGIAKFLIDWRGRYNPLGRLHGTSGFPVNFEEIETFDCVRLLNLDILALIDLLGPSAVREGISIVFAP